MPWFDYPILFILDFIYFMIILIITISVLAILNPLRYRYRKYKFDSSFRPTISVIVPAHNEEDVIRRTINRFLKTSYPSNKKELIIVDDGSSDKTLEIVKEYATKIVYTDKEILIQNKDGFGNIVLVNNQRGGKGKSFALNEGLKHSRGKVLLIMDADVQLSRDIFEKVAPHFFDTRVGAVAGYVEVSGKRGRILNDFVDFECTLSQKVMRLGFDTIGIHYIIPGGCGFFRRSVISSVGDYEHDTLAEDTDMTWKIATETNKKIHFDAKVKVIADEPTTLESLWNQRIRWARGNFQVTWKHLYKFGLIQLFLHGTKWKNYGKTVTYGYPFWVASIIIPITFLMATGVILTAIITQSPLLEEIPYFGQIFSLFFFGIWILGVIMNMKIGKWKLWWVGLVSPGPAMMLVLFTNLPFIGGVQRVIQLLEIERYASFFSFGLLFWILTTLFMTYFVILLSKKHPRIANTIQLAIIGYWSVLILSSIIALFKEIRKEKLHWIRTVR